MRRLFLDRISFADANKRQKARSKSTPGKKRPADDEEEDEVDRPWNKYSIRRHVERVREICWQGAWSRTNGKCLMPVLVNIAWVPICVMDRHLFR